MNNNRSDSSFLDRPLWLHFLPLDTRNVAGVTSRLSKRDQFVLLRWLTIISCIASKDFCVINAGTIEECDVAKAVLADAFPLIEAGLIRFSMKENDFLQLQEKKKREYAGTYKQYSDFGDSNIYNALNSVARITPREHSIGASIASIVSDDSFINDLDDFYDKKYIEQAAEFLPKAASFVRNEGLALTWPQLNYFNKNYFGLPSSIGLPITLTAYFEANQLSDKFCILGDIPYFDHADRVVSGVPRINLSNLIMSLNKFGILDFVNNISCKGVVLLREKFDFAALHSILMDEQKSPIGMAVGGRKLLDWANASVVKASFDTSASILESDKLFSEKMKEILDSNRVANYGNNIGRAPFIYHKIIQKIDNELCSCDNYNDNVKKFILELLQHIICFCSDRMNIGRQEHRYRGSYLFRSDAVERDLQFDLREFLKSNFLSANIESEVSGVGGGRADILVRLGEMHVSIELKRYKLKDITDARKFYGQAAAYQITNIPISFLGILDVSPRSGPAPHLEDNFLVDTFTPQGSSKPIFIVFFRVPGCQNRPSDM